MTRHKSPTVKAHVQLTTWDRAGIALSALCLAHCLITPVVILSLPILARYYLLHPLFHWVLALFVVPVGLWAFARGYRHHRQWTVLALGLPGLFLVGVVPILLDTWQIRGPEAYFVTIGSLLLVTAHWRNHRSCRCADHRHG